MAMPTYVGAVTGAGIVNSGVINRNWPAGHASGDVVVCFVAYGNNTAPSLPTCSGITFYEATNFSPNLMVPDSGINTDYCNLRIFYAYANSGAMGQITFNGTNWYSQHSWVFRGTGGSGSILPFNAMAIRPEVTTTTNIVYPSLTTTADESLIVSISYITYCTVLNGANHSGTFTNAGLTSITTRLNNGTTSGDDIGVLMVTGEQALAGTLSASTGISALAATTGSTIVMAVNDTPYVHVTEKYFYGTSGATYLLTGTKLLDLKRGRAYRVKNMTNLIVILDDGRVFRKIQDNVLVDN